MPAQDARATEGLPAPKLLGVVPILYARDLSLALSYYKSTLGFQIGWTFGEPLELASICRDYIELNISQAPVDEFVASRAYIYVDDIDAYFAQIAAAGAHVTYPLEDRHYGMRDCRIKDPDGNQISFGMAVRD